jgi:aldose 1-epimerase
MMEAWPAPFGSTPDGRPVELHRLRSAAGLVVEILTYGAAVHRVLVPADDRAPVNVALGCPTLEGYLAQPRHYLGAIVGRCANRIAGGRLALDGVVHELARNEGQTTLHGGPAGFDAQVWEVADAGLTRLALRRVSPDGEMGFPGTLEVEVVYAVDGDALRIDYRAVADAPTVVNLTNHTCWNLAGEGSGSIEEHLLTVHASAYTPVAPGLIPTGEIAPVEGTPLDFRAPTPIGSRLREGHEQLALARGYDHNLVLDRAEPGALVRAARLEDQRSGQTLEVHTTEPGLQLYSGNFLDGTVVGTGGRAYRQGDGVALEPQRFPDAPNQPSFPSTELRPGDVFTSTTEFRLP